jgi:hypothetical protein
MSIVSEPDRIVPPDDLRDYLRTYVALSDVQYDAITLWTVHSHCFEAADTTPYLQITSTEARCGKTRLLEVLELVVDNPWFTGRVTGPALVRKIDAERPTLLLDETDATFSGNRSSYEILRGVLNTGYRLNGRTSYAVGGSYKDMVTYCPKALAGIGGLPSTLADRSIRIAMQRRDFEQVQRFRRREAIDEARFIRARLARYAAANLEALARARPIIPAQLDDRAADVWEPLLAIADTFGPAWATRARVAAVSLMADREQTAASALSLSLLADVKQVFTALDAGRISTQDLLAQLKELSETWQDLDGEPLNPTTLANLLRCWRISPCVIKFGKVAQRGYYRQAFVEAWRMLEPVEPVLRPDLPADVEPVLDPIVAEAEETG